jgi:4-hydroxy-tetrahydrodipicolinate synthase
MIFKILLLSKKQWGYGSSMQIVKDKPKDFLVISGDDMIALPMVLEVQGYIRYRARFPKEFSEMIRLGLNRKVDEAFKIQYLSDCIDMILNKEILPE